MNKFGFFILIFYFATSTAGLTSESTNENPLVDALIVKLQHSTWGDDETTCLKTTLEMLYGVKNKTLWAVWAWDAMQPPVGALYATRGHFGNYDQCLKAPWSSTQGPVLQYCLVDVETDPSETYRQLGPYDSVEEYLKTSTKYGRSMSSQMFGVCLPSSCRPETVGKVFRLMHQLTYLTEGNVTVDPRECQVAGESEPKTIGYTVFWRFIAALTMMVAFSTYYCNNIENKNKTLEIITKPFCLKTNMAELVKQNNSEIKVMNGMKFLSCIILLMVHEGLVRCAVPLSNTLDMERIENTIYGKFMIHTDIIVDTFVTMSAILVAKGLLSGNRDKNLLVWLLKRYIRLIGPYALLIFFVLTSLQHTGDGPIWNRGFNVEVDMCKAYWWKSLLMINNDVTTVCNPVSWYVSADYQLAALGTFFFYLYRKNKKVALSASFVTAVLCAAKVAWLTYSKRLPLMPFDNFTIFMNFRKHLALNDIYYNIESRVASYFIGMAMGYYFTVYKPSNYRNTINKTWSAIIMGSSLLVGLVIFCLKIIYNPVTYNPLEVAILGPLNKIAWVFCACGIILVSEYGCKNLVTDILSLSIYGPLSKLSYGVYLVHFLFEQRNILSTRSIGKYDLMLSVTNSLGIVIIAHFISLIIYILVEAPMIKIANDLFKEKKVELNSNGVGTNGVGLNGVKPNGVGAYGVGTNGVGLNGVGTNGVVANGVKPNGVGANGVGTNGVGLNGVGTNGVVANGVKTNGVGTNGVGTCHIQQNGNSKPKMS